MIRNIVYIHEKLDIKILILFIMRRLPEPVPLEELMELTMSDDGVGYFDFMECITELVNTEHLQYKDEKYSITAKGERNGELTEESLPNSVRNSIENTVYKHRSKLIRDAMIKTLYYKKPNGEYNVSLILLDGVGEVLSMEMLAVNKQHALALEKGFRKRAERVYNMLIELILK